MKQKIIDNIKTIFYALVIAIVIRSLLIQPFYIPSSSMEPTLLVGDRIFVTKYTYGYSKHSFPFSLGPIKKRIFFDEPERGDIIVFKTPADNRTDYIKRLIGGPGDKIQFIDGNLYLNDVEILKSKVKLENEIYCGGEVLETNLFEENPVCDFESLHPHLLTISCGNVFFFLLNPFYSTGLEEIDLQTCSNY